MGLPIGYRINGQFTIEQAFQGGMGAVYVVSDAGTREHRRVMKCPLETQHPDVAEMFVREAQTWIDCGHHPHIVRAFSIDRYQEGLFVSAEYIEPDDRGRNTVESMLVDGRVADETVFRWASEFCAGMTHAHAHGVICHRDIKPANLMIERSGRLKISDFGIALPSRARSVLRTLSRGDLQFQVTALGMGTPSYMAPEQIDGERHVGWAADCYSFGVTLFRACMGRLPFQANTLNELFAMHHNAPRPKAREPFRELIARCMSPIARERYDTPAELLTTVKRLASAANMRLPEAQQPTELDWCAQQYALAKSLLSFGNLPEATRIAKQLVELQPGVSSNWQLLGSVMFRCGDAGAAVRANCEALRLQPDNDRTWSNLAIQLAALEAHQQALEAAQRAVELNPSNAVNVGTLANQLGRMERWADVLTICRSALTQFPQRATFWLLGGQALLKKGDTASGLRWLRQGVALDPSSEQACQAIARSHGLSW